MNKRSPIIVCAVLMMPSLSLAWSTSDGSADFVKNTLLDQPIEAVKKKYHITYEPATIPCDKQKKQACQKKSWDCKCHSLQLENYMSPGNGMDQQAHLFQFVTVGNRVVDIRDFHSVTLPGAIPQYYPQLKTYTGSSAPDEVLEGQKYGKYQGYIPIWRSGDLSVAATVNCPVEMYGGSPQVTKPLRDCYVRLFQATRLQLPPLNMKKVPIKY
jgi:hypothetical protein